MDLDGDFRENLETEPFWDLWLHPFKDENVGNIHPHRHTIVEIPKEPTYTVPEWGDEMRLCRGRVAR